MPVPVAASEPLCEQKIQSRLRQSTRDRLAILRVCPSVDSTNDAVRFLRAQLSVPSSSFSSPLSSQACVCLADFQSAGRGRRGKIWHSPAGVNLYLSIDWVFPLSLAELGGLSLVVGVVLADFLVSLGVSGVSLKWPNDVWVHEKKIAGILIESYGVDMQPSVSQPNMNHCHVVLGVGLNVLMQTADADIGVIDQAWTSLVSVLPETAREALDRNQLSADLLGRLFDALSVFEVQGFAAFLPHWSQYDGLAGREVRLVLGDAAGHAAVQGVAMGVDATGALLMGRDGQTQRFLSGEVRLC